MNNGQQGEFVFPKLFFQLSIGSLDTTYGEEMGLFKGLFKIDDEKDWIIDWFTFISIVDFVSMIIVVIFMVIWDSKSQTIVDINKSTNYTPVN